MQNYVSDDVPIQDLIHKVQEHEQEILQLRIYLTDCSVKVSPARHGRSYVTIGPLCYILLWLSWVSFDAYGSSLVFALYK